MGERGYEYWGLLAETWDLRRGDTSGWEDRPFYRDIIRASGEPALDVGCGTGRLLLDYLACGIEIEGVDNSPEMLAICRTKAEGMGLRPQLYQQAMQSLDLPRRYRTIMVPSSSFQLLTDPSDATEAMRRFFRHLEPGGTLVMPFMTLYTGPETEGTVIRDWHLAVEKVRPEDGATVRLWSRTVFDLTKKLEHTQDRFEVIREGEVIQSEEHSRSPATCWYTQAEAVRLYEDAGFAHIEVLSGFTREPAEAGDRIVCVVGRNPHPPAPSPMNGRGGE